VKIPTKRVAIAAAMTTMSSMCLAAAIEYRDALDVAVTPLDEVAGVERTNRLVLFVGDSLTYDNNIYLLPSSTTNLSTLPGIGSDPSRNYYIDRATGGLNALWLTGARQSFDLDVSADYNRYF
jgi:hypothetical protein